MTAKERMLAAFHCRQTDRVPVSPGIAAMIPCRLTGKPFWDIFYRREIPISTAYINAIKYFGFDGLNAAGVESYRSDERKYRSRELEKNDEKIVVETVCQTPAGDLSEVVVHPKYDVPACKKALIEDLEADFEKIKYLYPDPETADYSCIKKAAAEMGDLGVAGFTVKIPGLHSMTELRNGGLEAVTYDYYDYPELVTQWADLWREHSVGLVKNAVKHKPDFIMISAGGLLTLQSEQIFRELSLPAIKEITRISRENGIPTLLHACGKSRYLVETLVNETDLSAIEPLESPLMGDVDLVEVKQRFGGNICLKGNIHTTEMMLFGSVRDVENAAKKCIDDAAEGGGYILSTGDQCGRDTPFENLFALSKVAETYGRY